MLKKTREATLNLPYIVRNILGRLAPSAAYIYSEERIS
jgi:hypothetical protein